MATKEREQLRKITVRKVMGEKPDIEALLKAPGKRMDLMDVYGVVTKAKPGSSDYGEYVRFLGTFVAINLQTKEEFESSVCILPRFLEEGLYGALGTEGAQNVEFALRLSIKYDKEAATNYVYEHKNLVPTKETDAMQALADKVKAAAKALPAPSKS